MRAEFQAISVSLRFDVVSSPGFSLRTGVAGEYCKVTEGSLLWKGKALLRNKQNLAGKFCVVAGEFSDLPASLAKIDSCQPGADV